MKPRRIISLQFGLLTLVLLATAVHAQTEAEVKANYTKTEQTIAMRDGVKLFTSIYVPKDKSKKYPIMLSRTQSPQLVRKMGEGLPQPLQHLFLAAVASAANNVDEIFFERDRP